MVRVNSACVAPLVHSLPALAGCSLSPLTLAITGFPAPSGAVVTVIPQPTPQYEHAVRAMPSLWPVTGSDMPSIMRTADCAGFTPRYRQVTFHLTVLEIGGEV
ncbi:hypothetical protein IFM12275_39730 [Nocardia sputorum]|uniref:Uncharacterized protein n=1 Tax=Nocardia sputorum TaxID=2984338 RepID=A0ABN6UBM5_9NOCA|nr:hypothetical protein IFM12275_39730 [Nocardia sputorum]BDU02667.1 hypothetical protein IFM12276_56950 [Nocardia sputorum]